MTLASCYVTTVYFMELHVKESVNSCFFCVFFFLKHVSVFWLCHGFQDLSSPNEGPKLVPGS